MASATSGLKAASTPIHPLAVGASNAYIQSMKPRIPPPIIMVLSAALMWALSRWLPLNHWISPPWNRLGAILIALGVLTIAAAMLRFRQAHTTVNPLDPSKATHLVTSGVFSRSRNPMYLGLTLILVGWGVWLGSVSPWIIPPLFVIVITTAQIIPEEQVLNQLFGAPYAAYRQRVSRWIG